MFCWKYIFLPIATFLFLTDCKSAAQILNLVDNPSFETPVDFTDAHGSGWTKGLKNDTPDYIEFNSRGEPDFYYAKYIGGLLPFDGSAYVGIFCYRTNPVRGVKDVREFIQVPLRETLQKDTVYSVSLFIALDPESNVAINNFNLYFCRKPVEFKRERQLFELRPQIKFRDGYYDSISWVRLETTYKARGYESQVILGNFLPDDRVRKMDIRFTSSMMQKWNLNETEKAAYYYIDMVSIVKNSDLHSYDEVAEENPVVNTVMDTTVVELDKVNTDSSIILNNIYFKFDEAELLPESFRTLNRLFEQLMQHEDVSILIEGHTDDIGTYEYNMKLSYQRAEAVVSYLLSKGLRKERISYMGYGYTRPLSLTRDEKGRQMNRRVAFRITGPDK